MFKRMLIKEWKEKSGLFVFALVALAVFALALSAYSKDKETLDILSSTAILVFLPVFSILLGASGFFTEFQEDAWAYLFSRPVKKSRVWISKYLSLLTVLYAVILLFVLLTRVHPAMKSALATFNFPFGNEEISFEILACIMPLLLFTTAFSFSILSEKTHIVAIMAALTWLAVPLGVTQAGFVLFYRGELSSASSLISLLSLLIPLSFAAASVVTVGRADFSQPGPKAWTFTKLSALFVLAAIGFVALIGLVNGGLLRERYIYGLEAGKSALYFTSEKGFYRFDATDGRTRKVGRHPSFWGRMSLGGDKVAFVRYHLRGTGEGYAELRIMNSDGTEEKSLVDAGNRESPLYDAFLEAVCLSPRGDRVAFIARHFPRTTTQDLWTINSDGTRLRGYDLALPDTIYHHIVGFGDSDRALFSLYIARIKAGEGNWRQVAKLLRIDLESGQVETLADRIRKPWHAFMSMNETATSRAGRVAFIQHDEATNRESLTVYDPTSGEKTVVYSEDSVTAFRWNKAGDKIVFLTAGSKLGIYSPAENQVVKIAELKGYDLRWPSQAFGWTSDGRLILKRLEGKISFMCILDANLTEQKALKLPFDTYYASRFWSAGNYVIVENTENHQLWGVDLTTDKWLRIY